MKAKIRIISATILIVIGVCVWALMNVDKSTTVHSMEEIKSRVLGNGTFLDYDKEIGVTSVKDIGWWKVRGAWHVQYGNLELQFTPKQLKDKNVLKLAEDIGLDIRGNLDKGNLTFYWYNQKVEECVPK